MFVLVSFRSTVQRYPNAFIAGSVISGFGAGLNEMIALSGTAELVPAKLPRKRVHGVAKCQEERGVDGDDSLPRVRDLGRCLNLNG